MLTAPPPKTSQFVYLRKWKVIKWFKINIMLSIQRVTINYQDYFSKMKLKMFLSLLATHATDKYE